MEEHRCVLAGISAPTRLASVLALALVVSVPSIGSAYWSSSPTAPLILAEGSFQHCAPDSAGGTIVAWVEFPGASTSRLRVQRLDRVGRKLWGEAGVVTGFDTYAGDGARVAPDGAGGAFVVWRASDAALAGVTIRAQHLEANGTLLWGTSGIVVSDTSDHSLPGLLPDGNGGLFVSWLHDPHVSFQHQLQAQHLDAAGSPAWGSAARVLATGNPGTSGFLEPAGAMMLDGHGGVYAAFEPGDRLTVLRVDPAGDLLWSVNTGVPSLRSKLRPDGNGGVLAIGDGVFQADVQRIGADGSLMWPTGPHLPQPPHGFAGILETDEAGHTYEAYPDTVARTMRARRLDASGHLDAEQPNAQIGAAMIGQTTRVVRTPRGAAWLATPLGTPAELSPKRLLLTQSHWNGPFSDLACSTTVMQLSESPAGGFDSYDLAPGPEHSFVVGASSTFGLPGSEAGLVFLARTDADGFLGTTEPVIERAHDVAGDAGGFVRLHWRPSDLAGHPQASHLVYDVLRASTANGPWSTIAAGLSSAASGDSLTVPTLADSSTGCDCRTFFIVRARADGGIVRDSPPEAAASLDNGGPPLAVGDGVRPALRLWPVAPTPVRTSFTLRFALDRESPVELALFDAAGRRVRRLAQRPFPAGTHTLRVDLEQPGASPLVPGSYFVRLTTPRGQQVVHAVVVR